jgi:hypothetical protein
MKEEMIIEKVSKQNPFRVPEGYFDTLTSQIMAKVDESASSVVVPLKEDKKKKSAKVVWLRPVLYAAASVCALFISVVAYQSHSDSPTAAPVAAVAEPQSMDYSFDEAADYLMIDNQDIYACLSSDY